MNFIFFIGIGIALFLVVLIASKKEIKMPDRILMAWLLINALHLIFFYNNIIIEKTDLPQILMISGALLAYLSAPILYFYVRSLIDQRQYGIVSFLIHFLPFFIMLIGFLGYSWLDKEATIYVKDAIIIRTGDLPFILRRYALLMAFSSFAYPTYSIYLLYKHKNRIKEEFSFSERVTLSWLRRWLLLEIIAFWVSFIIIWVANFNFITYDQSFSVIATVITVNIFVIGLFGIKQKGVFLQHLTLPLKEKNDITLSQISDVIKPNESIEKLNHLMITDKPYLEARLTIFDLASKLEMSKHEISNILNNHMGLSFYDFVNKYRVEEFKLRLVEVSNSHLSLLGIALDCGFNSKSSFNLIFKKVEGKTPSQYKKSIIEA